jgi:hypothetical protein
MGDEPHRLLVVMGATRLLAHGSGFRDRPCAGSGPLTVILHTGYGGDHFDFIMGVGPRCPTVSLWREKTSLRCKWLSPHRRFYLSYNGPVSGQRGKVRVMWRGKAYWHRIHGGWMVSVPAAQGIRTDLIGCCVPSGHDTAQP